MAENNFLMYKGKPLVRSKNVIFYGDMTEKYVVRFEILSSEKSGEIDIANKVSVKLIKNDSDRSIEERVTKESEKNNLFDALDIGFIWLERALKD